MQIDWLTVAAQIVNFLVLVWLLQRFLYEPITKAMRRREERIEQRLAEAKSAREKAEAEAEELQRKRDELHEREEAILDNAREEAGELRERLEQDIREDMERKRANWSEALAEEREAFLASLRDQAGRQLLQITRRVMADYADSDLADRVVVTFGERLKQLDEETRQKLTDAAEREDQPALLETGSAIGSDARRKITRAVHEILSTDIDVDYREDKEMVLGVRLTIGDQTVEWSALRYLQRLEDEIGEIIERQKRGSRGRPDGNGEESANGAEKRQDGASAQETA